MLAHKEHASAPVASVDAQVLLCAEDIRWTGDRVREMSDDGLRERVVAQNIRCHSGDGEEDAWLLLALEAQRCAMRAMVGVDWVVELGAHLERPKV